MRLRIRGLLYLLVVSFWGNLTLAEGVRLSLAAQTNGTLGIPVYSYEKVRLTPETAELVHFAVVVTSNRQTPSTFTRPSTHRVGT